MTFFQGASTRMRLVSFCLLMLSVLGLSPQAAVAGMPASYMALKGGIYSPSASFNLDNVDIGTTFASDTRTGFNGEVAIGHYFLPTLAIELGAGYFKGKGSLQDNSVTADRHDVDFNVIPILASAKASIPAGPVAPYGELGIGAYFTTLEVTDNLNSFSGNSTFGMHAGGGANVSITPRVFLGIEGRYVWANPSFGEKKIKLNDTEYALNGFNLNGFTTTLGVGFSF